MAEKQSSNPYPPASEGSINLQLQVGLNLRATELRLGPPGSASPERDAFPADDLYGAKAGGFPLGFPRNLVSEKWVLAGNGDLRIPNLNGSGSGSSMALENRNSSAAVHASKAQVVGWPPIRSFRKNSMATTTNSPKTHNNPENSKSESGCLYVKAHLNTYGSYAELSAALENMFRCFTMESRLKDVQNSEQCVITYEDRDGDWMVVGDVPWE